MSLFLIILLCSLFALLQCQESKNYFVTRRDTKEAICIIPPQGSTPFPTFDMDKLQIPEDVGFMHWDWFGDWQLQNDTDVRTYGQNNVFIAGNQPFLFVERIVYNDGKSLYYILASNFSLWVAMDEDRPRRGAGMLFELDHLNATTKRKDTTLKYCNQNPETEGAKCTIVDYKVKAKKGTNHLNAGNDWTRFLIKLNENRTGVEMFEMSYGKEKPVVQWAWSDANISKPITTNFFYVFAKSHQRNAALWNEGYGAPDLAYNKEMKRNFAKRNSGKLCMWVRWSDYTFKQADELLQVKNSASGRVQPATNTTHDDGHVKTYFEWNHLDVGDYEFTLRFYKRKPEKIELCPNYGDGSNIVWTWTSIPKAIAKCQFGVGQSNAFSAWPSSTPDPTIQTNWTLGDWEHMCDRLGIFANDTDVQIKICNRKGCNFSKCPHLQHEPPYIPCRDKN